MPPDEEDEDSTQEDSMLYLYKYLFKDDRKIKAFFQDITENISKNDEIKLYIRGMFPRRLPYS